MEAYLRSLDDCVKIIQHQRKLQNFTKFKNDILKILLSRN